MNFKCSSKPNSMSMGSRSVKVWFSFLRYVDTIIQSFQTGTLRDFSNRQLIPIRYHHCLHCFTPDGGNHVRWLLECIIIRYDVTRTARIGWWNNTSLTLDEFVVALQMKDLEFVDHNLLESSWSFQGHNFVTFLYRTQSKIFVGFQIRQFENG